MLDVVESFSHLTFVKLTVSDKPISFQYTKDLKQDLL